MLRKLATLVLIAAALYASAQIGANASDVEGVRAKFREMDRNGDRALQFSEIQAARAAMFDRMDINGNAILDQDEIDNVRKIAQSKNSARQGSLLGETSLAERAKQMDANGDGRIERDEFVAYLPERLIAADKDGNQALSLRELRSLKRDRDTTPTQ
jgi:Ca2+-binding EF-hand superfamily protein